MWPRFQPIPPSTFAQNGADGPNQLALSAPSCPKRAPVPFSASGVQTCCMTAAPFAWYAVTIVLVLGCSPPIRPSPPISLHLPRRTRPLYKGPALYQSQLASGPHSSELMAGRHAWKGLMQLFSYLSTNYRVLREKRKRWSPQACNAIVALLRNSNSRSVVEWAVQL